MLGFPPLLAVLADLLGPGATLDDGGETLAWLGAAALLSGALAYVGAMVGLVLGQFRLPLLLLALGSAPAAAATNLAISSLGAGTGAYTHSREGRVELRLLLSIGVPSAAAAYLTSRSLDKVEAWWIGAVIGLTLLFSAVPLAQKSLRLRRGSDSTAGASTKPDAAVDESAARSNRLLAIEIVIGAALGALSGVVGLLLGTLRLPAMLRLGVSPQKAAGTNMAIGFFTGVAGALGAVGSGRVSWLALAMVGTTTVLGAFLGARRTKVLPVAWHYGLIAAVLIVVAAWLIGTSLLAGLG
jgi:uncharacterized membrane protein YfcA